MLGPLGCRGSMREHASEHALPTTQKWRRGNHETAPLSGSLHQSFFAVRESQSLRPHGSQFQTQNDSGSRSGGVSGNDPGGMNSSSVRTVLLGLATLLTSSREPCAAPATPEQKAALKEILRVLPKSEPWEKWLAATGTMPPNFDTLPNAPFLPDPLRFTNGREVKREDWPRRRAELLGLFQHY